MQNVRIRFRQELLDNGESTLEALARGRYLLYKYPCDWTEKQAIRAKSLFKRFPQIQKSHELSCLFRTRYSKFNIGKSKLKIVSDLLAWFNRVKDADIDELLNFSWSVQRNQLAITNYFTKGDTNAKAENINRRINQCIIANNGTRNLDFFFFKIKKMFV